MRLPCGRARTGRATCNIGVTRRASHRTRDGSENRCLVLSPLLNPGVAWNGLLNPFRRHPEGDFFEV